MRLRVLKMSSKPLIKEFLSLLNVVGLACKRLNFLNKTRCAVSVILLILVLLDALLECFLNFQGLNSVDTIVSVIGMYLLLMKCHTLIVERENLYRLLNKMEDFWCIDKYGTKLKNEIENIYKIARRITKVMITILAAVLIGFLFQPFFSKTRKLPFKIYFPRDINISPDFELGLSMQVIMIFFGVFMMIGFDGLLVSLIIHVMCELKLLRRGFEIVPIDLNVRRDTKKALIYLYEMINHQNLILECIKSMRHIFSFLLLNVYIFNMGCICYGLLGVIQAGLPPTVQSMSQYGMFAVYYAFQIFFYCLTGNYLNIECQNISMAVYNTNWWIKTQPKLRRAYTLIILRANKVEELTAGGMFSLNLHSFRKVMKGALSFFTLTKAVYKDQVL